MAFPVVDELRLARQRRAGVPAGAGRRRRTRDRRVDCLRGGMASRSDGTAGQLCRTLGAGGVPPRAARAAPCGRGSLCGGHTGRAGLGYYAVNELRGFPSSPRAVLVWTVAAVLVGPVLGLAAHWLRTGNVTRAAAGVGVPVGVLVGEGVYGLRYKSRYHLPAVLAVRDRLRHRPARSGICAPTATTRSHHDGRACAAVGGGLRFAYTADLIALLRSWARPPSADGGAGHRPAAVGRGQRGGPTSRPSCERACGRA